MVDAVSIALTGLTAQKQRLAASANNIANVLTSGEVPAPGVTSNVYKPLRTQLTSLQADGAGIGVRADTVADENGYTVIFDPTSAYANGQGNIAVPNVDLNTEFVNITETKAAYKADISVLKIAKEMDEALLDILA